MNWISVLVPDIVKDYSGPESPKIQGRFSPYLIGRILDVGVGEVAISPQSYTVDMRHVIPKEKWNGRHVFGHAEYLPFKKNSFDTVVNSHSLEHIPNDWTALCEMWRVLKVGGHLLLYLPLKGIFPSCQIYTAHYRDYEPKDIMDILSQLGYGFDIVECDILLGQREFSFALVIKKIREVS